MGNSHYAAVIADLVAKRDALNVTIQSLQAFATGDIPSASSQAPEASASGDIPAELPTEGRFLGLSIVEGTNMILKTERRKMKTAEIVKHLEAGGMEFSSASVTNTVGSVLNRRMHKFGDIVTPERGYWGLKEWYPGRTFGKKSSSDTEAKTETTEPSQPCSQENVVPMSKADLF